MTAARGRRGVVLWGVACIGGWLQQRMALFYRCEAGAAGVRAARERSDDIYSG